jgi:hypothetical protein
VQNAGHRQIQFELLLVSGVSISDGTRIKLFSAISKEPDSVSGIPLLDGLSKRRMVDRQGACRSI